ncbi:MAG TPA: hypothetical protein VGH52_08730 [Gaiellaceae bacterium]|jgi:Tol biopolymer transport system component
MKLLAVAAVVLALSGAVGRAATSSYPQSPVFSTDGQHIAWYDANTSRVWIAARDASDAHAIGAAFDGISQLAWTRYGLIVDSNFRLFRLSTTGSETKIGVSPDQYFAAGGSRVASGTAGCGSCTSPVVVYEIVSHARYRVGSAKSSNAQPTLSPDGKHVVYTRGSDRALVEAAVGGHGTRRLPAVGYCARWSPNGRSLSFIDQRGNLAMLSLAKGKALMLRRDTGTCVGNSPPAWSPDSTMIAVGSGAGPLTVVNVRTHAARQSPKQVGEIAEFSWSPDGATLVVAARAHASDKCFSLWRIDAASLRGSVIVRGCP